MAQQNAIDESLTPSSFFVVTTAAIFTINKCLFILPTQFLIRELTDVRCCHAIKLLPTYAQASIN